MLVGMIVPHQFVLIGTIVSRLSTLAEVTTEKYIFFKIGTKFATMDFRLRPASRIKAAKQKGKCETCKVLMKS